jgi:hypothetical protein
MTRTKILAAATVGSMMLIAAGATFRDAHHDALPPSSESNFDERWNPFERGDRLPLSMPAPSAAAAQSDIAPPLAAPPEQLPLATDDDMRQADEEHHRHRDICPHGRTYFTIEHHQYWRCKL